MEHSVERTINNFHMCFDLCPVPCCITQNECQLNANNDVLIYANNSFCELVGNTADNIIGSSRILFLTTLMKKNT